MLKKHIKSLEQIGFYWVKLKKKNNNKENKNNNKENKRFKYCRWK